MYNLLLIFINLNKFRQRIKFFYIRLQFFFVRRERNHAPLSAALFCNAVSSRFQTRLLCTQNKPCLQ